MLISLVKKIQTLKIYELPKNYKTGHVTNQNLEFPNAAKIIDNVLQIFNVIVVYRHKNKSLEVTRRVSRCLKK